MILKERKKGLSEDELCPIETIELLTIEVLRLKGQLRTTDEKLQKCKQENLRLRQSPHCMMLQHPFRKWGFKESKDPNFLSPAISPIWIFVFALALLIVGLWGGTTFSPAGGLSFLM